MRRRRGAGPSTSQARIAVAGLAERAPDPRDGRATLVSSTAASDALRVEIEQMWCDLEAATVGDLTEADLSPMLTALAQVETNLSTAIARIRPASCVRDAYLGTCRELQAQTVLFGR